MGKNNKEYMRLYQAKRRAKMAGKTAGFAIAAAEYVSQRMQQMNIPEADIFWALTDAAGRGVFGEIKQK